MTSPFAIQSIFSAWSISPYIPLLHAFVKLRALPFILILLLCLRPLQDHLHGLVVISLDLEVRHPAVALRGGNLAMPQEFLNGSKISIGVEKLCGHSVPKPMTRDVQLALSRIVFDPLLNTSYRYGGTFHRSLLHQEQSSRFR
jgi:hypothetical protein